MAVVLGVVVEILVLGDDLDQGERGDLLAVEICRAGQLAAGDALFDQHRMVLGEGILDGVSELLAAAHARDPEARAALGGLHEHGELQLGGHLGVHLSVVHSVADIHVRGAFGKPQVPDVALAGVFVEDDRAHA